MTTRTVWIIRDPQSKYDGRTCYLDTMTRNTFAHVTLRDTPKSRPVKLVVKASTLFVYASSDVAENAQNRASASEPSRSTNHTSGTPARVSDDSRASRATKRTIDRQVLPSEPQVATFSHSSVPAAAPRSTPPRAPLPRSITLDGEPTVDYFKRVLLFRSQRKA
jgi:hypothetical protein